MNTKLILKMALAVGGTILTIASQAVGEGKKAEPKVEEKND